ncbi:MAG: addiction module protein [Planctomycetota bacterium]
MTATFEQINIERLSADEREKLLRILLERIQQDESSIDIPDWHLEILKERMERFEREGSNGQPVEVVRKELLDRLK